MIDLDQEGLHLGQVAGDDDGGHAQPVGQQREQGSDAKEQALVEPAPIIQMPVQGADRQRDDEKMQSAAATGDLKCTRWNLHVVALDESRHAKQLQDPIDGAHGRPQQCAVDQIPGRDGEIQKPDREK